MNVKRYIAPNAQEAMIKIKNELGRDAIILHTRKIRQKGLFGFFKKHVVEVVAAVEEEVIEPAVKVVEKEVIKEPVRPIIQEPVQVKEEVYAPQMPTYEKPKQTTGEIEDLKSEIDEIKNLIKNYIGPKENTPSDPVEKSETHSPAKKYLLDLDIDEDIADKILGIVRRQVNVTDENDQMVKSTIRQAIKDYLGQPFTIDHHLDQQRVFLFVGPTGVGKTTTLAKLAAKLSLLDNKKVGLITADTYRIAAVDQLKTYSEILGIPLSVVYEASEISDVMYKYRDKDIVLLDTAGRSHKSDELSRDLQDLMGNLDNPEIFLVLSLTTGYKDIISILEAYSFLDDYKIIFTKLDEASTFGNMLNIKVRSGKTLSYLTTGQSVPDDIETADSEKILNYIVGDA